MSYKVAFETFGCRLNQAETAIFARQFKTHGYELTDSVTDADLCIINTCTLTSQATAKCRRLIRSIVRRNPDACIAAVEADVSQVHILDGRIQHSLLLEIFTPEGIGTMITAEPVV